MEKWPMKNFICLVDAPRTLDVVLALPSVLGAWSMALVLWLPFECYHYNYVLCSLCVHTAMVLLAYVTFM